jgi:hypothetical protein
MAHRSFWSLAVLALCGLSLTGAGSVPDSSDAPGNCDLWMQSIATYDRGVDAILDGGELDQLLDDLHEAISRMNEGSLTPLQKLQYRTSSQISALRKVDPPDELEPYHVKLVDYHFAVFRAARKAQRGSVTSRKRDLRVCYVTLLDCCEELHTLLVEHGCDSGDIQALEENILPDLRSRLATWTDPASN